MAESCERDSWGTGADTIFGMINLKSSAARNSPRCFCMYFLIPTFQNIIMIAMKSGG